MHNPDTILVTDDPQIAAQCHGRYPGAQHFSLILSDSRTLFVVIDATTLRLSSWTDERRALLVLGNARLEREHLRAAATNALSVAHLDTSPAQLPNAQWIIAVGNGTARIQGTPTGLCKVYVARDGDSFCASNRARALAHLSGAQVDLTAVSMRLLHPLQYPLMLQPCWSGIEQLSPDEYLEVDPSGTQAVRWWEPPARHTSLTASARATATALTNAIATALDHRTIASFDVSGGLDSCSVTALAARIASGNEARPSLHGWTSISRDPFNADPAWAQRFSNLITLQSHDLIASEQMPCRYDDLASLIDYELDEPSFSVIAYRRFTHLTDLATQAGSQAHFCGSGGDEMFTTTPAASADQLSVAPLRAARNLLAHRALHRWPLRAMGRQLASRRSPYRRWLSDHSLSQDIDAYKLPNLTWGHTAAIPPWMTADAADELRRRVALLAATVEPLAPEPGRHFELAHVYRNATHVRTALDIVAQRNGIPLIAPMFDAEVLVAALSVNPWIRSSPYDFKPVLKQALLPLIDGGILVRESKGAEDTDGAVGLQRNIAAVRELLSDSRLVGHGLVDRQYVRGLLKHSQNPELQSGMFDSTVAAELWLRSVETNDNRR